MSPELGGIFASELLVCRGLSELGHSVRLFTSDIGPGRYERTWREKRYSPGEEVSDGFTIHRSKATANLGGDMPFLPDLGRDLQTASDSDVIHAHEYYNWTSWVTYRFSKKTRIPFTFTQERYYEVKRRLWRLPFSIVDRSIGKEVRESSRLIAAFTSQARDFLVKRKVNPDRIVIIPMCVDTGLFNPKGNTKLEEVQGDGEIPILLTVARLHPSKGLRELVYAMREVVREVGKVRLVILGRGSMEKELRELIQDLGLVEDVQLVTKRIAYSDMGGIFRSVDLFVLPSLYEPFGLSALEAMSCSRAVIGTDVGGMRDMIEHGRTGLKVPPGDINGLAGAITRLVTEESTRKEMGKNGRARVVENFDWRIISERYERFYGELLNER